MRKSARRVEPKVELIQSSLAANERGAIAAYGIVLRVLSASHPARAVLEQTLADHQRRLATLETVLPDDGSVRPWKKMNGAVLRMAASIHPWAAIQLLAQGEVNGVAAYEAAVETAPAKVKPGLVKLLAAQRAVVAAMQEVERGFGAATVTVPMAA